MRIIIVFILFLSCFLAGCRAKLDTSSSTLRRHTDEIGVELRKLDSLWRCSSERQTLKIEFYRPEMPELAETFLLAIGQDSPSGLEDLAAAPDVFMPAAHSLPLGGGMGAVKSIEISTEKEEAVSSINATDSTYYNHTDGQETREANTTTEARQDNGTVAVVAIVVAAAGLIYLMFNASRKL